MFVAGPPDAAVIMIGANDITALNGIGASAHRLGAAVQRRFASGAVVVVGTCPDFGVITAIPSRCAGPPGRADCLWPEPRRTAVRAGGIPVPLADLLTPNFRRARNCCSPDRYPPVGGRIRRWRPTSCCPRHALGRWTGATVPEIPGRRGPRSVAGRLRFARLVTRLLRRRTTGVPAPIVVTASWVLVPLVAANQEPRHARSRHRFHRPLSPIGRAMKGSLVDMRPRRPRRPDGARRAGQRCPRWTRARSTT